MKISAGTIARTIILGIALLNQVLTALGYNVIDVSDDTINTLISTVFTVGASLVAWWKNNSFTKNAIQADETLKGLKSK